MRFILLPLIAMLIAVSGCNILLPANEDTADISLADLLAHMKKSSDPQGMCANAKTYFLRQQQINDDGKDKDQTQVEVLFQRHPYFSKTTIFKNGEPSTVVLSDGLKAWNIDVPSGRNKPITGMSLALLQIMEKISNPAYSYSDVFSHINLSLTVSGTTEYYKLVCTSDALEAITLTVFVNKNNYLTKKIELALNTEEGAIQYTSYINEYALYENIMMPETITTLTNGVQSQYRTLAFKLNVDIPPSEFELPVPWYLKNIDTPPKTTKVDKK